jgi:hypothetical protein
MIEKTNHFEVLFLEILMHIQFDFFDVIHHMLHIFEEYFSQLNLKVCISLKIN